ncbi:MAG: hypothetical protein WEB57_08790 [Pseudohongiellaceae bacterium]
MATTNRKSGNPELEASKKAAMEALDNLIEARSHFRQAAEAAGLDLRDEALQRLAQGKARAGAMEDELHEYVNEKPLQTLGIAFLGGFILSKLLSRS